MNIRVHPTSAGVMLRRFLGARSVSMALDVAAFMATWWAATMVVAILLSFRHPDNPWGNLAVAVMAGFPISLLLQAALEATTGTTVGRTLTGLRVVDHRGHPLSRIRLRLRAALKASLVVALVWAGLAADAQVDSLVVLLMPLASFVVVNAATCLRRRDGRSIVDLVVGSRSTATLER